MTSRSTVYYRKLDCHSYKYELTQAISFRVPELRITNLRFSSHKDFLVALSYAGTLTLKSGYRWDGCTGIGRIIETQQTLIASLLHDFLYQLSEQSSWTPPFSQREADKAFRRLLPCWAKPLYYLGVRVAGWAYWGDKEDSLIIQAYD